MLAVFDEIGALDVTLSYIPELKITYLSEVLVLSDIKLTFHNFLVRQGFIVL